MSKIYVRVSHRWFDKDNKLTIIEKFDLTTNKAKLRREFSSLHRQPELWIDDHTGEQGTSQFNGTCNAHVIKIDVYYVVVIEGYIDSEECSDTIKKFLPDTEILFLETLSQQAPHYSSLIYKPETHHRTFDLPKAIIGPPGLNIRDITP